MNNEHLKDNLQTPQDSIDSLKLVMPKTKEKLIFEITKKWRGVLAEWIVNRNKKVILDLSWWDLGANDTNSDDVEAAIIPFDSDLINNEYEKEAFKIVESSETFNNLFEIDGSYHQIGNHSSAEDLWTLTIWIKQFSEEEERVSVSWFSDEAGSFSNWEIGLADS